jgi:hypothetical protein
VKDLKMDHTLTSKQIFPTWKLWGLFVACHCLSDMYMYFFCRGSRRN